MNTTRVYVPSTLGRLREIVTSGGIGPGPVLAHAVTDALRQEYADGVDEDWEYAALSAAAYDSLALITEDEASRRVVIAVDISSVFPVEQGGLSQVEVHEVIPAAKIAAVLVDTEDAEPDVTAAAASWAEAEGDDAAASAVVERCMDRELGWFASQEIGDLLEP